MRVLLAFDKFKDSMSATDACAIAAAALSGQHPHWTLDSCPLADGGEGFATILTTAARGELRAVDVTGPRGDPVRAQFGLVRASAIPPAARRRLGVGGSATVALIEMASASGLALLGPTQRDVWHTTTIGTGELLRAAAEAGANAIVVGVGGSATNDLGLGALTALGLQLHDSEHGTVPPAPANWDRVTRVSGNPVTLPPVYIACDVTNPLLGPRGAAAVYGPQKGLRPADLAALDHASARLALMLCGHFGQPDAAMDAPGAGAAGGIAFGLMVGVNARLLGGFEFVNEWFDLDARIAAADMVLTGEGRFDQSSLSGKGPGAIAARAVALGKPAHVFAGAVTVRAAVGGPVLHSITGTGVPLDRALREAPENLALAVRESFPA